MIAQQLAAQGFTGLVSVVPPDGTIAPNSRIREDSRGKVPGRLTAEGWAGYDFTDPSKAVSPEEIDRSGANLGILGDFYPGLDVDCEDETLVRVVVKYATDLLGTAPKRFSRRPRTLLMFKANEPFPKSALRIKYKGQDHVVEMLGRGRQYVIAGTHPSGSQYTWDQPLVSDDPEDDGAFSPDDLTTVSEASVEQFFEALAAALNAKGIETERVGGMACLQPPPQESLLAPSIDALRDCVSRLPNDYGRDKYVGIGHAIRAAAGEDPEAGLEIFQSWAARWVDGTNDPDVVAQDYASFKSPYRVGWPSLEREVYSRAQELLEAKEELQIAEEQVRELQAVMPPGLDDFTYDDGPAPEPAPPPHVGLKLVHVDAMLARPKLSVPWVVHGLLPMGGLSLMAAKPKVGKSTLTRQLAVAVSKGEDFLGRATKQGPVLYISLEDPAWHVQNELERLGAAGGDLWVFEGPVPGESHKLLWDTVVSLEPVLIIVDTAQRWLRVKDMNDYSEVTKALDPLLQMARELRPCVHFNHHSPKGDRADVADAALGSTALFGSVDIGFFLTRDSEGRRFLTTRQRITQEPDIDAVVLEMDPETHATRLGQSAVVTIMDDLKRKLLAYVCEHPKSQKGEILASVIGGNAAKKQALQKLVDVGRVKRDGIGVSGHPFTYTAARECEGFDFTDMEEVA